MAGRHERQALTLATQDRYKNPKACNKATKDKQIDRRIYYRTQTISSSGPTNSNEARRSATRPTKVSQIICQWKGRGLIREANN